MAFNCVCRWVSRALRPCVTSSTDSLARALSKTSSHALSRTSSSPAWLSCPHHHGSAFAQSEALLVFAHAKLGECVARLKSKNLSSGVRQCPPSQLDLSGNACSFFLERVLHLAAPLELKRLTTNCNVAARPTRWTSLTARTQPDYNIQILVYRGVFQLLL